MKRIHIVTLGGTIAYLNNDKNRKSAEALLSELGELPDHIELTYEDLLKKASSDLTMNNVFQLAKVVKNKIAEGIDGIVVTQGTDTMEETSFMLDLLIENKIPIVFTGALRHAGLMGSDGNVNLFSAITVASMNEFCDLGCLVVIHEEIHVSRYIQKNHTQSTSAFQSQFGPIGYISEGNPKLIMRPNLGKFNKKIFSSILEEEPVAIFLASMSLGEEGSILDLVLQAGYRGMVIDGLGGGHVSAQFSMKLPELINKIPVIVASRTGNGEVLKNTYQGYMGSEVDLINMGCIYAGILDSRKARILLSLLVTVNASRKDIKKIFQEIGELR